MKLNNHRILTYLGTSMLLLFVVGVIIRSIGYPNQLFFFIPALLLTIFIFIPIKSWKEFEHARTRGLKGVQLLMAICSIALLLLAPVVVMDPSPMTILVGILLLVTLIANNIFIKKGFLLKWDMMLLSMVALSMMNAPILPQVPDKLYQPNIENPTYPEKNGPTIYLDEAHRNFHQLDGLYWAFGEVLRKDGYQTQSIKEPFSPTSLRDKEIIVIANALHEKNETRWINPTYSAFTQQEQLAMHDWVKNGGSLFLIADHMPTSGAAADLASQFGIQFINGFAMDTIGIDDWFTRENGTISDNEITNGYRLGEEIDSILTFTGQAFIIPDSAQSILTFDENYVQWEPDTAWRFRNVEPYTVEGYSQGMYMSYGKGKVVAFGEAMMFTSQLGWGLSFIKLGLSSKEKKDNQQLLLNIIHWLDDTFEKSARN